jgi:RimJ/RimL family protein N-acetyltransferase
MPGKPDPNVCLINGDICCLRPWRAEDAEWYVKSRDEVIFKWTKERRDLTVEQAASAIREVAVNPDTHCFAIVERSTGDLAGNIALVVLETERTTAEIMYWLAPEWRGRGLASGAISLLSTWVFRSLGLERIVLKTHPDNIASQQTAERAGFRRGVGPRADEPDGKALWFMRRSID